MQYNEIITIEELNHQIIPISFTFPKELFYPHIRTSIVDFILPLLTEPLYNDFVDKKEVIMDGFNCTHKSIFNKSCYDELWDKYLLHLVSWAVLNKSLPYISVQIQGGGLFQHNSFNQNEQVAGNSMITYLQKDCDRNIEIYTKHIREFICKNIDCFDKFNPKLCREWGCACGVEKFNQNSISINHGIVMY